MQRRAIKRRWVLLLLGVLLLSTCGLSQQGRAAITTGLLLPHLFPGAPARPLTWFTPAPIVQKVSYPAAGTNYTGDLYRPADSGKHGAFVLLLGVNPVELTQPELVEFCNGLARAGIVVLVHDPPELRNSRILPQERDGLVAAFEYLQAQPFVDTTNVGMIGFSVGAALVAVAAEDERINNEVAVVNFFGGYYDILDFLRAVATRRIVYKGEYRAWEPSELTVQVFTRQLLETVDDPADYTIVYRALVEKVEPSTAELEQLGGQARLVYTLFNTRDPAQVDALIGQLPPTLLARLRAVSPHTNIGNLKARMLIMHDIGDRYVPYVESRRLVDALPASQRHYTEFSIFAHVMVNTGADWGALVPEAAKLYYHVYLLLIEVL